MSGKVRMEIEFSSDLYSLVAQMADAQDESESEVILKSIVLLHHLWKADQQGEVVGILDDEGNLKQQIKLF